MFLICYILPPWKVCFDGGGLEKRQRPFSAWFDVGREVWPSLPIQRVTHLCCLWCSLVALSLLSVADSSIVEVPNNTVTFKWKSSEAVEMPCKSDWQLNLLWYVRKNRDSGKETLYNGYFLRSDAKSYCTVIPDEPGKCYLRLKSTAEAAQTYICLEPGTLAEASAELIWLGDLICSDSSTEDLVNLTCSVEFRGNWAPTMEWTVHSSDDEKVLSVGVSNVTVPNQRVTTTLVVAMQEGSRNYTCTTKFDISGKPPQTTATNIPQFTFSKIVRQQDEHDRPTKWNEINYALILGLPLSLVSVCLILLILGMRESNTKKTGQKITV